MLTEAEVQAQKDAEAKALKLQQDIAAGICDEEGVPWKNRAAEAKRKQGDAEKLRLETQQKLDAAEAKELEPPAPAAIEKEEDEWTKQQREIARQELQKERQANARMRAILSGIEAKEPVVRKYHAIIEARLSMLSQGLRCNPASITMVVNAVKGENLNEILKDNTSDGDSGKRIVNLNNAPAASGGSQVLPPAPTGAGARVTIELSKEEIAYGNRNNLFDKGFTDAEVREQYNKRQAKLKEKKEKK